MTRTIPTPLTAAAIGAGVVVLVAALGFGRVDLAVMGVLIVVAAVVAPPPRPDAESTLILDQDAGVADDGGCTVVPVRVMAEADGAELIVVSAATDDGRIHRAVLAGARSTARARVRTAHTGDRDLVVVTGLAVGADGAWTRAIARPQTMRTRIEPHAHTIRDLPLPPSPSGLTGAHDAPRPGDGGEFRDIHPFTVGDRLRRIDWKATARLARRPGDLFVRRSMALSDVDVAIVLDDGDDITGVLDDWVRGDPSRELPTSLDVAREAAYSLAAAYLDQGDQVSFHLLSGPSRSIPRGSGARHRDRLRAAITAVSAQQRMSRRRTPLVPRSSLVVLLSTFLDDEVVHLAGLWRAGGHRVIAVDVLPQLRTERLRREQVAAGRIILGARADRLARARGMGVDVLIWDATPASRAAALRAMTRRRRRG